MAKKQRKKRRSAQGPKARTAGDDELVIIPVRNMVLFPGVVLPLMIGREATLRAMRAAAEKKLSVGLLLQRDESRENPAPEDLYAHGTQSTIIRYWTAPDDRHHAICQGEKRFRVLEFTQVDPYLVARVELIDCPEPSGKDIEGRFMALKHRAQEVLELAPGAPEEMAQAVRAIESPAMLADMVSTFLDVPPAEKQELLELVDLRERLDRLNQLLGEWAEVLSLSQKIRHETRGQLDAAQREYFLREQLRIIQRELGEGDPAENEIGQLTARLDALKLPDPVDRELRNELQRLKRLPEHAGEHSMLRTYLELAVELPWNERSSVSVQLNEAQRVLDEDHHGLEKVKGRILDFLAVRKLNPGAQGSILCLVGPPGVGKTSLGRSVARALGREFVRISMGGVHDEAEVRGHRRTYIGAMPGRIIDRLRHIGTRNPVFMLDELDKMGRGPHGDPASAMLEVLDPAQNHAFVDNYLGVPFDLSEVMFLGTANVIEHVHPALHDRLEVIHLAGYTEAEKLQIARRFLVKRQIQETGLSGRPFRIRVGALRELIRHYTREAGVRGLEREIAALCRHGARHFAGRGRRAISIDAAQVSSIRGSRRYEPETVQRTSRAGVAVGLAWTPVGGEILFIEAAVLRGKGRLVLTGQLGEVMRESAQAALTLVRSRDDLGIDEEALDQRDVHLHIPAGAVPKDGPSAGVTMFTALVSLLSGRRVRGDVAMTGEISLRGLVLPVGGIREKVLAAKAAGLKRLLLPARNRPNWEEIPEGVRAGLTVSWMDTVDDALAGSLGKS